MMNQTYKYLLFITFFSLIVIILFSCNNAPTEPIIEPGSRDYLWVVDTLNAEYAYIYKIWGSSPSNVWAVGPGSGFDKTIWHYDGNQWNTDAISRNILPRALWGFSSDDVYIGGQDGKIWRYNGQQWSQFAKLDKEGTDYISIENIWGIKPDDFYAVGAGPDEQHFFNKSVIVHFSHEAWEIIDTKILIGDIVHFYTNKADQKKYFRLTKIGGAVHPDSTIIYEYREGNYIKLYVSLETIGKRADIFSINNEVYFVLGNEIVIRENDQFKTLVKIDNPNFYQRMWGRNSKDIFLLMVDGLAHYNGINIEYLFYFNKTPQTQIYGAALFEKEVFFTVYEASTDLKYIYHGTLKE